MALARGIGEVRKMGERLAGAAPFEPTTMRLDTSRLLGAQQTSTAQMLGSQPSRAAGSGGEVVNNTVVYVLKSDEWVEMVRRSEKGEGAADYVGGLERAFAWVLG